MIHFIHSTELPNAVQLNIIYNLKNINYMDKYVSIKEASLLIGVTTTTLRRWESSGSLISHHRTIGNHRRYSMLDVLSLIEPIKTDK